jgi:hypothetical protein
MQTFGGERYRWRGRAIRTICKDNTTYVTIPRRDSIIMMPCNAQPNTKYEVRIIAQNNVGNGSILVNFFSGQEYDGEHIQVNVTSPEIDEYVTNITTPNFQPSMKIYLRVWRANESVGNIFIKSISFDLPGETASAQRELKLKQIYPVRKNNVQVTPGQHNVQKKQEQAKEENV